LNNQYDTNLLIEGNQNIKEKKYWLENLSGRLTKSQIAYDYRERNKKPEYREIRFEFENQLTKELFKVSAGTSEILQMIFIAGLVILIEKYTSHKDIIIGTPIYMQEEEGDYLNTILVLRNLIESQMTFKELLFKVRETLNNAVKNQDYPVLLLADQLEISNPGKGNPLFDIMILMENIQKKEYIHSVTYNLLFTLEKKQGQLYGKIEYNQLLYQEFTILRLKDQYQALLLKTLTQPESALSKIEMVSEAEKEKIIKEWNQERKDLPREKTVVSLFADQAKKTPNHIVLVQGEIGLNIDYKELRIKIIQLSQELAWKGMTKGSVFALLAEPCIEMVMGIFGILQAGGVYLPISHEYPKERVQYFLKDTQAPYLLTHGKYKEIYQEQVEVIDIETFTQSNKEELIGRRGEPCVHPEITGEFVYVIYTSGSTGLPKGVLVKHQSLVNLCIWHNTLHSVTEKDRATKYAGFGFDASAWEIFPYLIAGASLYIVPDRIKLDMEELNHYYEKNSITISFLPTQVCEQFQWENNKSLRVLLTGGDKLRKYTGQSYQLYNNYGPTENTIVTTSYLVNLQRESIPIGKPIYNTYLYILGEEDNLQPIGIPGELCVGGDNMAAGYLNKPTLTMEKFIQNPWQSHEKIYRTGDLGRRLYDGNIEFIGRNDNQVKIRGIRIEPAEIEYHMLNFPGIKEAVVAENKDQSGDTRLYGYIIPEKTIEIERLKGYLNMKLPAYMIPSQILVLEEIPLTPNGKIDYRALPQPEPDTDLQYQAPRNSIEKKLSHIWSEVLKISCERIGAHSNFFEIGGHSLRATQLQSKIYREFHLKIPLPMIFQNQTLEKQAIQIKATKETGSTDLEIVEKREYYELSFNQKRLWIMHRLEPQSTLYHIPGIQVFKQSIQVDSFRKTINQIFERHESFRTGFLEIKGNPVQIIRERVGLPILVRDLSQLPGIEKQKQITNLWTETVNLPFNLQKPPLFRSVLVKLNAREYMFMFNVHHIISDGWSLEILKKEFLEGYQINMSKTPQPSEIIKYQYKDFAHWHHQQVQHSEKREQSYYYWKEKIKQGFPQLQLPNYCQGEKENRISAEYRSVIPEETKDKLDKITRLSKTTLFMVCYAFYNLLLSYLTGQEEIVCSVISAGRLHISLYSIIGYFTNSVTINTRIQLDDDFDILLEQVNKNVQEALKYQEYPIELVLEELKQEMPEVKVAFNFLNMQDISEGMELQDLRSNHNERDQGAKFQLELFLTEYVNAIEVSWVYQKALFKKENIEKMAEKYLYLIEEITDARLMPGS
jgi:bacitracin synthase 1